MISIPFRSPWAFFNLGYSAPWEMDYEHALGDATREEMLAHQRGANARYDELISRNLGVAFRTTETGRTSCATPNVQEVRRPPGDVHSGGRPAVELIEMDYASLELSVARSMRQHIGPRQRDDVHDAIAAAAMAAGAYLYDAEPNL